MVFHIIHPDRGQLEALGIAENNYIKLVNKDLQDAAFDWLENGKFGVVTPGNSFGKMDGGYDLAIVQKFGEHVQNIIQDRIAKEWYGELPVGCATSCETHSPHDREITTEGPFWPLIIYAPTMQVPMVIRGSDNVYRATLAAIREADALGCKNLLLPLMGAGTGGMHPIDLGYQMKTAIEISRNRLTADDLTWEHAMQRHSLWHRMVGIPE